jgi:hypothetical protein
MSESVPEPMSERIQQESQNICQTMYQDICHMVFARGNVTINIRIGSVSEYEYIYIYLFQKICHNNFLATCQTTCQRTCHYKCIQMPKKYIAEYMTLFFVRTSGGYLRIH